MPTSQRVRVVVPADSNIVHVRRISTSVWSPKSNLMKISVTFFIWLLLCRLIELLWSQPRIRHLILSLLRPQQLSLFLPALLFWFCRMLLPKWTISLCQLQTQSMRHGCGTSKLKNWYQASLRCILCWAMSLSLDTNWILMFKFSIRHNLGLFAGTCCHLFHDVKRDSN